LQERLVLGIGNRTFKLQYNFIDAQLKTRACIQARALGKKTRQQEGEST